jgi:glycosyltransferase involved in cell wall biosynthesis
MEDLYVYVSRSELLLAAGAVDTIICFSHLRWNFVYQRPQHLLSRAARHCTVYFIEEPIFQKDIKPHLSLQITPQHVTVAVPILPEGLSRRQITKAQRVLIDELVSDLPRRRTLLWYYTPMALPFSRHLKADLCVYDNMDELSAFRGAPPRMIALERELFRKADVIFTGGQSLYEAKCRRHPNVHLFPSSIDAKHFAAARSQDLPAPPDQLPILQPRIGFFGVIDERMDVDLVGQAAHLRPDWQFVMIGPTAKIDPACLPQRSNLHWLGPKKYSELPAYLAGWSAGIMPFALNESTRFISPTKTPEFLAAGLPVVSTAITDVIRPYGDLGLVEIAHSPEELVAKVGEVMSRPKKAWLAKVDQHLSAMSWDLTWSGMNQLIEKALSPPVPARAAGNLQETARV